MLTWAFGLPCLVICWTNPKWSFDEVTCCLQLYVAFFCREEKGSMEGVNSRWFFTWDSKSKTEGKLWCFGYMFNYGLFCHQFLKGICDLSLPTSSYSPTLHVYTTESRVLEQPVWDSPGLQTAVVGTPNCKTVSTLWNQNCCSPSGRNCKPQLGWVANCIA